MTSATDLEVNEKGIVRHYRAQVRSEVERAYRTEALQAAGAGYVPTAHNWSQDPQGFLLVVTYGQAIPAAQPAPAQPAPAQPAPAQPAPAQAQPQPQPEPVQPVQYARPAEPTIVAAEPQPVTIRDLNGLPSPAVVDPADEFAPSRPVERPDPFAPSTGQAAGNEWLPPLQEADKPIERYTPPPETYMAPPDMYVPVGDMPEPEPGYAQLEAAAAPVAEPEPEPVEAAIAEMVAAQQIAQQVQQQPEAVAQPIAQPVAQPVAAPVQPTPQPEPYTRQPRLTVQTMDLHAAGEPLRIIRSGFPDVPMLPVLERRKWVMENADHIRRSLMLEPRGHRDMYGAILLPPHNDYADMTVLFMHNEGYSTMCGHGIIAITTGLIEEGLYPATEPVTTIRYEVPAGIVAANAATIQLPDGTWAVRGVRFTNVPSYLAAQSLSVRPDGVALHGTAAQYGALGVDLAFGGAYYGIVNAAELGLRVVPEQADALRRAGAAITEVLRRDHTPAHPTDPALSFVYGTIIVDLDPRSSPDGRGGKAHIRNATIFADAELDRSPCGSGTSAILAQLHARGRIRPGQEIINAGITGEHFLGRIEAETALGPYAAVSTSIAGTAYVTGYSTFVVDPRDPLGDGFLLS